MQHNQLFLKEMQFNNFLKERGLTARDIRVKYTDGQEIGLDHVIKKFTLESQFDDLIKAIEAAEQPNSKDEMKIKDKHRLTEIINNFLSGKAAEKTDKKFNVGKKEEIKLFQSADKPTGPQEVPKVEPVAPNPALAGANALQAMKDENIKLQQQVYEEMIALTKNVIGKIINNFQFWHEQVKGGATAGKDFRVRQIDGFKVLGKVPDGIANMNEVILNTPVRENIWNEEAHNGLFRLTKESVLLAAYEDHLALLKGLTNKALERESIFTSYRKDGSAQFYNTLSQLGLLVNQLNFDKMTKDSIGEYNGRLKQSLRNISQAKEMLGKVGDIKISAPITISAPLKKN